MRFPRASGLLLHPTSLPGPFGIGDFGPPAYAFVDFLAEAGQSLWQLLPLGPTGLGNSPYQSFSAFAGNPLLISPETLLQWGLVDEEDLAGLPSFLQGRADYEGASRFKMTLLREAAAHFFAGGAPALQEEFQHWCEENRQWLEDYALYMVLKEAHNGAPWYAWRPALARRDATALLHARADFQGGIHVNSFIQFCFFRQWHDLHTYAGGKGLRVIGDIPIFVAYDSADVWAHPELFHLDEQGRPTVVAGVPPDYFSPTGQLWGNPLYNWARMAAEGYAWWASRFSFTLKMVDIVRVDHFRGFEAYWEVPAGETTAVHGRWVKGPGASFFQAMTEGLGELPIIAEDLGIITPEVEALRDALGFPGMKILQFAFGDTPANPYLPHNYSTPNCVVYSGTHDNDTTLGWFAGLPAEERAYLLRYLGTDGSDIAWDLLRLGSMSIADLTIFPLQDVLRLGGEARMNYPGRPTGNWEWRLREGALTGELAGALRQMALDYRRYPVGHGSAGNPPPQ